MRARTYIYYVSFTFHANSLQEVSCAETQLGNIISLMLTWKFEELVLPATTCLSEVDRLHDETQMFIFSCF